MAQGTTLDHTIGDNVENNLPIRGIVSMKYKIRWDWRDWEITYQGPLSFRAITTLIHSTDYVCTLTEKKPWVLNSSMHRCHVSALITRIEYAGGHEFALEGTASLHLIGLSSIS